MTPGQRLSVAALAGCISVVLFLLGGAAASVSEPKRVIEPEPPKVPVLRPCGAGGAP